MRELNNYYKEKLNASEAIWEIITTKNECICNYIPASSKTSYSKKTMLYYLGWESIYCSSNSGELVAAVKQNMQSLISKSLMTRHLN